MQQLRKLGFMSLLLVGALCFAFGQSEHPESEHPESKEHPQSEHPENKEHPEDKEHPESEHPEDGNDKKQQLTVEEFADAAEKYIKEKANKNDGYFIVKDKKEGEKLKLKLLKIHRKRLAHLGNDRYFVCADFKAQNGNKYDIDIFMTGTNPNNLEAEKRPMVHKVNGEARFTYYQNDEGVWKRQPKE